MILKMAKLIAVCRSEDYQFERRQIPLFVDESLTVSHETVHIRVKHLFHIINKVPMNATNQYTTLVCLPT